MRIADGEKFHDHCFTRLDFHRDFFRGPQSVEECRSRQNGNVSIGLAELVVLQENFRVEQVAEQRIAAHRVPHFFLQLCLLFRKLHRGEARARASL